MEKIKLGIIGAGRIGKLHAENLMKLPYAEIKWISDIDVSPVSQWAEPLGIANVTSDYREILRDSETDAVFICSSTHTHAEIITEAAAAGKHIFCEKPVSFSVAETEKALAAVEKAGVKLQVGFNRRFDHNFKKVHDAVVDGVIGEPHIVKITSRDPEPPSKDYISHSGGIFMDMTIHDFDMARYLTGEEVEEIFVRGANLIDPSFAELGDVDTAVTVLTFRNGAIAVIDNSRQAVYGYDQRVEVFGSKGSIAIQNDAPTSAEISTAGGVLRDNPKYFFLERYNEAYVREVESFIGCLLAGETPSCTGVDGLRAELMARAAKQSLETGRSVKLERPENLLKNS